MIDGVLANQFDEPPQEAAPEPSAKTEPVVAKAALGTVTISDFEFAPAFITVDVGDTVTWSNAGPTPHSATGDSFDTDIFEEGEPLPTFSEAGTFDYMCTPHPDMKGTVIVRAVGAQGDETRARPMSAPAPAATTARPRVTPGRPRTAPSARLPATGVDAGGLFALGLVTLVLGALLASPHVGHGVTWPE